MQVNLVIILIHNANCEYLSFGKKLLKIVKNIILLYFSKKNDIMNVDSLYRDVKMRGRPADPKNRENIVTAAISLFVEKGYQETTAVDIAKRAKVSSSHMYIYFENKERLLVEAVRRMEAEHTALSTDIAEKCVGLDDEGFIDLFYEAQAKIRPRVRFIAHCMMSPGLAYLFEGIDFDFSGVFVPFLKDWPQELSAGIARTLMDVSIGYFFFGDIDGAKASSLNVLKGARALWE